MTAAEYRLTRKVRALERKLAELTAKMQAIQAELTTTTRTAKTGHVWASLALDKVMEAGL